VLGVLPLLHIFSNQLIEVMHNECQSMLNLMWRPNCCWTLYGAIQNLLTMATGNLRSTNSQPERIPNTRAYHLLANLLDALMHDGNDEPKDLSLCYTSLVFLGLEPTEDSACQGNVQRF
jgi:hypothetical protein